MASKAAALYDHASSKKKRDEKEETKTGARMAESRGEEKVEAKKEVASAKESEGAKEADKGEAHERGEDKGISKIMEGLKTILKSHETERRDMHGNHREELRKMHARHEKAIRDHMAGMEGEGAAEAPAGEAEAA